MFEGLPGALALANLVLIHLGIALVLGSLACDAWLRDARSAWGDRAVRPSTAARRAALVLILVALPCAIWLQAAVVTEVPLLEAGPAALTLMRQTRYGHVALAGVAAGPILAATGWPRAITRARRAWLGLALVVLLWSRGAVSHAGALGALTADVAIDMLHLGATSLWVGMVLIAVAQRLPAPGAPAPDRLDAARWVAALSSTATATLAVVVLTGAFKTWRSAPTIAALSGSDFGRTLGIKVALVAVAVALGGFNRYRVLPGLLRNLRAVESPDGSSNGRHVLKRVLRLEAFVLVLVSIAAAILSGSEPPRA